MQLTEGKLTFTFDDNGHDDNWRVEKYDDWSFYRKQFNSCCGGNRAVDFLAYQVREKTLWLIEVKDYRHSPRTKDIPLWEEVASKVRDTLAGIFAACVNASDDTERHFAAQALRATRLRVVLHLEQPPTRSKVFPRIYDPADVQQKIKHLLKPVDAHPRVVACDTLSAVPWKVTPHASGEPK
jgi:hypothetical protein